MHGSQVSLLHVPPSQKMHWAFMPHPRATGLQPVTWPAAMAAAHVVGVQQLPPEQTCPAPHEGPQLTLAPQPLRAVPQVAEPHDGAGHVVHVPPVHWVPLGHPPQ
jgi:hypothetical protein